MQRRASSRCDATIACVGQISMQRVQVPQCSLAGTSTGSGVRANDGTVFVSSSPEEKVAAGNPALAAVRPESILLASSDPGRDHNQVPGTVASVSHFGDVLQYVVRTAERDIVALLPRQGAPRLVMGDEVFCHWSDADVYQFSADQADLVLVQPAEDATQ